MSASARQVRKTVTILFCDLVHSTELAEGDPEAYRRVQTRYFEEMRVVVERHGGTVEKFIGDEVMAVFGIPSVHEDDALRAVRTAQEMLAALRALNDELSSSIGSELEARIGVNTGEVLAGDPDEGHGFVAGEPVIVAKRLAQAAEAGEILIGKATYPLVANAVKAGPLERIPVKGKGSGVGRRRVHEVDREAPGVARRLDVPLVGRQEELGLLRHAFDRAVAEQSCRLFTVLGPAGIGKSRLMTELIESVDGEATSAVGRCLPYGEGITFWPLIEILQAVGGVDAIGAALGEADHGDRVLELLAGAIGAGEAVGSSEETFWAVRRAFEAISAERPFVVCFEDVHWAETTLLDLIEYVVGWCRGTPIFVVCLARPDLVEVRPTWIGPQPNADALALEPLSSLETATLLDQLSANGSLEPDDRERIAAAAEGNPLFVEQMAAVAAEREGDSELSIPPSIRALLAERLDRLGTDERAVIERASIVGRDFSLAAVAALSPDEERTSVARHLFALVRRGLVRPDPGRAPEADRFQFHHVLVRDAAYEALPKELRAGLHERLADWVAELRPPPELEELVAYHLEQAYKARTAVGARDEATAQLGIRAGRMLGSAGQRAVMRDDVPAAIGLLERAAALLEEDREVLTGVLIDLGSALHRCGDLIRAESVLEQAIETAGISRRDDLRARALVERSSLRALVDPEVEADDLLRVAGEAIEVFESIGDDLGLARALIHVANVHWMRCRCAEVEHVLARALVHAERVGSRPEQSLILGLLARAAVVGPRPVPDAISVCLEIRDRARGSVFGEGRANSTLAALEAMRGEFDEARRLYRETRATLEEMGQMLWLASLQMYAGYVELTAGDYEAAERELRRGYEPLREMGERGYLSTTAGFLARPLYELGRHDEADEATRVCEEAASRDDLSSQVFWRGTRAKLLAVRGEPGAEALAREAVALSAGTDFVTVQAEAQRDLAETLHLLGRQEEGLRAQEEAVRLYEAKGNLASAARTRAAIDRLAARETA
jgi:class 3 adenylate cyclase/tetratricopeptide (TPR) repeat protein